MRRRVYGALAALCIAGIGLDAWAESAKYPVLNQWFNGRADDIARTAYVVFVLGAGVFGYLAGRGE